MATEVVGIGDDDEISILYSTPPVFKSGASKSDAISVDDYHPSAPIPIDLTQDDDEYDVVELPPNRKKRFFKGESSNSKQRAAADDDCDDTVLRRSFTCEICTVEKPLSDHRYCTLCISNYVAAKLQDNITRITCPVPGCGSFLEPPHCRTILPKAVFERWGDALCEALILGAEKYYCPYKDCSALLIDDDRNNANLTQSECPECWRLFCVSCKVAWHSGIECGEFQKLSKDERSNEDLLLMKLAESNNWIRCPKCRFYVSKSEGCLYMRCRCGYSFCYNCGAQMNQSLHYCSNCKH